MNGWGEGCWKPKQMTAKLEWRKKIGGHDGAIYLSAYHDAGSAFAPLVSISLGQLGPDLLRFLCGLADHAGRNPAGPG